MTSGSPSPPAAQGPGVPELARDPPVIDPRHRPDARGRGGTRTDTRRRSPRRVGNQTMFPGLVQQLRPWFPPPQLVAPSPPPRDHLDETTSPIRTREHAGRVNTRRPVPGQRP